MPDMSQGPFDERQQIEDTRRDPEAFRALYQR